MSELWVQIGAAVALAIPLARLIVSWTQTDKDDKIVEKVVGWLKSIFGIEAKK